MKRVIVLFLMLIYCISSFGMGIERYYCCGKLASVSLTLSFLEKPHIDKGKCCKTAHVSIKIKDNHTTSNAVVIQQPVIADIPVQGFYFTGNLPVHSDIVQLYSDNSPPDTGVNIYTLTCNYRI